MHTVSYSTVHSILVSAVRTGMPIEGCYLAPLDIQYSIVDPHKQVDGAPRVRVLYLIVQ